MKHQLITISAFIIFYLCTPAQAQTPQGALADATQMVAAEANITRDAVSQMLRSLADQSASIEFNAQDYRVKTVNFQQRVSAALQTFETQMQSSIFRKLGSLASRYNAIYNSASLSAEQKERVLAQQLAAAQDQVVRIEQEYHQAIRTVYQAVGDLPLEMQVNWIRDSGWRDRRRHGCRRRGPGYIEFIYEAPLSDRRVVTSSCVKSNYYGHRYEIHHRYGATHITNCNGPCLNIEIDTIHYTNARKLSVARAQEWLSGAGLIDTTQIFQTIHYPVLSDGCRSQICLALSAADLRSYLNLVSTSIDREIYIPLVGGNAGLRLRTSGIQVNGLMSLLSSMNYPAEVQDLPFDTE